MKTTKRHEFNCQDKKNLKIWRFSQKINSSTTKTRPTTKSYFKYNNNKS